MKIIRVLIVILCVHFAYVKANDCVLTFIVPCYNSATTLEEAIESIYSQQLSFRFEVICTDDGSTDNTFEILEKLKKKYPNFDIFRHEKNRGASEARNTCVKHASGSLLFNLDSDNILVEGSIQKLVEFMFEKDVEAAAFAEVKHFIGNVRQKSYLYSEHYLHKDHVFDLELMFKSSKSPGASGNYLYTKESYYRAGGYSGEGQETWVFCFKQLATGTRFAILPSSYYWHRYSDNSYWWRLEQKGLNNKHCFETVKQFSRLFMPKTCSILRHYGTERKFFHDLNAGYFIIRPLEELKRENMFDYYTKKLTLFH